MQRAQRGLRAVQGGFRCFGPVTEGEGALTGGAVWIQSAASLCAISAYWSNCCGAQPRHNSCVDLTTLPTIVAHSTPLRQAQPPKHTRSSVCCTSSSSATMGSEAVGMAASSASARAGASSSVWLTACSKVGTAPGRPSSADAVPAAADGLWR